MKHLIQMMDLSSQDIFQILDLADQLKYERQHHMLHNDLLVGKSIGLIFEKASTRTRVSFETGAYQLGAQALFLSDKDLQIHRGEAMQDTARVLSRYLDAIMIRTYDQEEIDDLVKYSSVPIINGLSDFSHPCQTLADLMTMRERFGVLKDVKVCYIGDGCNVANSLIVGCLLVGMHVSVATPKGYEPNQKVLDFAKNYPDHFMLTNSCEEAILGADVVVTDTWASMGCEDERPFRLKDFEGFTLNESLLSLAKPSVMVQHPLPAYRGQEITEAVFEAHADEIFDEAENRLHVQNAVMVLLMKDN